MKIMISAGEVSGDLHGAHLVNSLKPLLPDCYFFGMGSDRLRAAGVDIKFDIVRHGTIGFVEALPSLLPVYSSYLKMVSLMRAERPAAIILIDSQGVNVPLASAAKKLGIKTIYYIAPQEWLWGIKKGVQKIGALVGLIIAIFKKEFDIYRSYCANVSYFGHPLIDIVKPSLSRAEAIMKYAGASSFSHIISVCPGSRAQEIKHLFPIFVSACKIIKSYFPRALFLLPSPNRSFYEYFLKNGSGFEFKVFNESTYDVLSISDLAICASGTINLEASLLCVPNIMVYKLSPMTYLLGKHFLKIDKKLSFFSMPNILLNKKVIPELIMRDATPEQVADAALALLNDPSLLSSMKSDFIMLRDQLGSPGVLSRAASRISDFIRS